MKNTDLKKLIANPLIQSDFEIIVREMKSRDFTLSDEVAGLIPKKYVVEQYQITKVYHNPNYRIMIANLSPGAKSLFLWLVYEVDPGKDYIAINKLRYMKENRLIFCGNRMKKYPEYVKVK